MGKYTATMSVYLEAEDSEDAIKKAMEIAKKERTKFPEQECEIDKVYSTPFATEIENVDLDVLAEGNMLYSENIYKTMNKIVTEKNSEVTERKGIRSVIREGTVDEFILRENEYDAQSYESDDVWLDAGGNIGLFTCKYHDKVKKIVSYEPDDSNFLVLLENLRLNNVTNCVPVKKALVANEDTQRSFYINVNKNMGSHTLFETRGRIVATVDCEHINNVIHEHGINKIKMDVEGAELELLHAIDYTNIEEIVFEYHFNILDDSSRVKYRGVIAHLQDNGFEVDYRDEDLNQPWMIIVRAAKNKTK